jgi:hypothetical protein
MRTTYAYYSTLSSLKTTYSIHSNNLIMSKTQILKLVLIPLMLFSTKSFAFQYEIIHYEAGTIDQTSFDFRTKSERKVALVKGNAEQQSSNLVKEFLDGNWIELNPEIFENQAIISIDLGIEGELIIATPNGLYSHKNGVVNQLLSDYYIDLVQVDPNNGDIYFVEEDVLYRIQKDQDLVEEITSEISIDEIKFRSNSELLIKSGSKLFEYKEAQLEERYIPDGLKYWSLDQNSRLWIITEDNQFLKENDFNSYWEIPIYSEHLIIEGTTAMTIDKDGIVWISNETDYGRLMMWEPGTENSMMISSNLLFDDEDPFIIEKVVSDDSGNIYLINNEKETLIELSYNGMVSSTFEQETINWSFGPNPVSDVLNVSIESDLNRAKIEVLDQTGRIVLEQNTSGQSSETINVTYLRPGFYFLQIRNEEILAVQKFIKL